MLSAIWGLKIVGMNRA